MNDLGTFLRAAGVVTVAILSGWWFSLGTLFPLLLGTMLLDMAFGAVRAAIDGRLDSSAAWRGAWKKTLVIGVVALAEIMERMLLYLGIAAPFGIGAATFELSDVVCVFYLWHESVSILEHAVLAGLPVPAVLRRALSVIEPDPDGRRA